MKRGEVWWAELPAPIGRRPVTLVSRNEAYKVRDLIMVAPVTTRVRHIPTEVKLDTKDGMPRKCVINCDSLVTIPKARLQSRITMLSPDKIRELNQAIKFALGLP
ncbi:MAG: type II toxin-antitoxin system PemK/MazF family toxin [Candidatus Bipolaricaulota bacterium]|nr:type II toxin-antitoxin system PemK/MazF family toxin [Candidatus Bipolaricaulota bacterium]MCS7274248.1 type II toxin-antitoxin system PemK/MazF family toxin [Candidatus Bipolaricaulota bacterium]MDW8110640.1 type II toxin-antitoxin system PemK/MazF family toxin [Candidatus Bipolaricaulota bacterium]MDW8328502.1 type II toxin-antitoxin system PemK/MazF family toxin [Candidatus Bipolaricaulota bacterium]